MNLYQKAVSEIAEKCAADCLGPILTSIEKGHVISIRNQFEKPDVGDRLEQFMMEYWSSLTDATNDYWKIENVTVEDKMLVFRKLQRDVQDQLEEHILKKMAQAAEAQQAECARRFKAICDRATGNDDGSLLQHLLELQQETAHLLAQATQVEHIRMYLTGKGVLLRENAWKMEAADEPLKEAEAPAARLEKEELHKFERKLRGGAVASIKPHGTFVPESEIRKMGFEHGDLLRVKTTYRQAGQTRYEFELFEKKNESQPQRVQLDRCLVRKDAMMFYVDTYMEDGEERDIRLEDSPYRFIIRDDDVKSFKLAPGERVDLAYWANHPSGAKVIWKHLNESPAAGQANNLHPAYAGG